MEPIMEFKTQEEVDACLKEWQTRLFLDDWTIKVNLCPQHEMNLKDCSGENCFQMINKCAVIQLVLPTDDIKNRIQKVCHEKILIHELLHCKYNWIDFHEPTLEEAYYDISEHALLEQMAKSLIMTKYNITYDWFKNF